MLTDALKQSLFQYLGVWSAHMCEHVYVQAGSTCEMPFSTQRFHHAIAIAPFHVISWHSISVH